MSKELEYVDHVEEAKEKFLYQYTRAPNFIALVDTFISELNLVETEAQKFNNALDLPSATGVNLDYWVDLLDIPNRPSDDDTCRALVYGYIAAYYSEGTSSDIVTFVNRVLPNSLFILTDNLDGSFSGSIYNPLMTVSAEELKSLLKDVKPAGVIFESLDINTVSGEGFFAFATDTRPDALGYAVLGDDSVLRYGGFCNYVL